MTARTFRLTIFGTVVALIFVSISTFVLGIYHIEYRDAGRTLIPVYIGVSVAWLTYCLQRRVAFTNALRALWDRLVGTFQDAIQYTHLDSRSQDQFSAISKSLSCRVDEVRGVFKNIGEVHTPPGRASLELMVFVKAWAKGDPPDAPKDWKALAEAIKSHGKSGQGGLYPVESLRRIQDTVSALGFGEESTAEKAKLCRATIVILWGVLRGQFLNEFDRDHPQFTDTPS